MEIKLTRVNLRMYLVVSSCTLRSLLHRRYHILAYCSKRVSKTVRICRKQDSNVAILLQLGKRGATSEALGHVLRPRRTDGVKSDPIRILGQYLTLAFTYDT